MPRNASLLQFRKASTDGDVQTKKDKSHFIVPDFSPIFSGRGRNLFIDNETQQIYGLSEVIFCYARPEALSLLTAKFTPQKDINFMELVKLEMQKAVCLGLYKALLSGLFFRIDKHRPRMTSIDPKFKIDINDMLNESRTVLSKSTTKTVIKHALCHLL